MSFPNIIFTSVKNNKLDLQFQSSHSLVKPLLRGHFHQAAFFLSVGASLMLILQSPTPIKLFSSIVYSICLTGLFGLSALYHRPNWGDTGRSLMKRLDHSAIFLLIAGSFTPICLVAMEPQTGRDLILIVWAFAIVGIFLAILWPKAPKWLGATIYLLMGWLAAPYISDFYRVLGVFNFTCLVAGGVIYSLGAIVYVIKKPNPIPEIFGYHEVFHLFTILAAILHFILIANIILKHS